jgi:hypothetical protein
MGVTQTGRSSAEPDTSSNTGKRIRIKTKNPGYVNSVTGYMSSDDGTSEDQSTVKKRRLEKGRRSIRLTSHRSSRATNVEDEDEDEDESDAPRKPTRASTRQTRSTNKHLLAFTNRAGRYNDRDELADHVQSESDGSDILFDPPKRKTQSSKAHRSRPRRSVEESDASDPLEPTRKSGRERVVKSMKERDVDEEIYADEASVIQAPKVISIREVYQEVSKQSQFYRFHSKECDVCAGEGNRSNKGISPLILCQGCSSSIHKVCLGYRSGRDPIVTKVGHENFVMQCRRCIGLAAKKDPFAPRLDTCQECQEQGSSCAAFSSKKTAKQEEKLRNENGGDDPITAVPDNLVNNANNVLFRCETCRRAWHFEHLPSLSAGSDKPEGLEELRNLRLHEYSEWQCKDCQEVPGKVQALVAWRPADRESYENGKTVEMFREDEKEYLIKWQGKSYFKCTWMPGGWVWGVTSVATRNKFVRRDERANALPKFTSEEAIRKEFLRMEIIFAVKYNGYHAKSERRDKSHITDVDEVLVKFQGLGYDETVWEKPPAPDDKELWDDFVEAYNEYLAGKYFKVETAGIIKKRIDEFLDLDYAKEIKLKDQPSTLTGGEIMPHQVEGMNWLLRKFHHKKNAILADEMGLGKTIQIIAFIAALVTDKPKVWPLLDFVRHY